MHRPALLTPTALVLVLLVPATGRAGIDEIARCQKKIAGEGARFAQKSLSALLKCTVEVTDCQLQCEEGVFGPPCDEPPQPGCCDPDDPSSNSAFQSCMDDAERVCDIQEAKIAQYENNKQARITTACTPLSPEELCGSQAAGLNFATLNAGCLALDPGYVCNLPNLIACVGGPLEQALLGQIAATLHPRAGEAVAALGLQTSFPDIPVTRKVRGVLPPGKVDVWVVTGAAGDELIVKVNTRNDVGDGTSLLEPAVTLLSGDLLTPVADTSVKSVPCAVPNVCGSGCPLFKRRLPFSGTFGVAVRAPTANGCSGGSYRRAVTSPTGVVPLLVADDVAPATP
jgi:hypothetical protein